MLPVTLAIYFGITLTYVGSTAGRRNCIQRTLWTQLVDLDYVYYLALSSHVRQQKQRKTAVLSERSKSSGFRLHSGKSKVLLVKTTCRDPVTVGGNPLEIVNGFVYLDSVVDEKGGTDIRSQSKGRKGKHSILNTNQIVGRPQHFDQKQKSNFSTLMSSQCFRKEMKLGT